MTDDYDFVIPDQRAKASAGMTMVLGGSLKAFNEKTCFFLKNGLWERALERKENTHD
ncbi:MAG: hypothetical protein ACKO57_08885 [Alphaproteobacteria bacterium]